MTVPEENRPKTTSTDDIVETPNENTQPQGDGATGRTLREALEEAGISPDDVRDES
ncbi:3-oxoacyl-(acyl-carrier-protein) synthase [Streptomyces sp. SAI-208]|uniref:hypothetical protein n=1 Tax=Streptomyces sp. SAI-208 TaxID=2940550 RepID=UPI00247335A1|nr:hypothetical protein [Streptomyces sp. SAI-208]MDH6604881.1 3-oxoacyl-(acyl-carrier-protein) synthase [Streptomyces sp. SAI-208]